MTEPTRDPVHRARYAFEPDGDNLFVDAWIEPGGGLPAHLHPRQEERWSVIDGEVRFQLDRTKRVISSKDGELVVPAGTKHAMASVSDREAHLRCHVLPARDLQAFLEESAAAAREGLFMRGGIPRSLRGARWAAAFLKRHRDDVVMSFPPPFVQSAMIALIAPAAEDAAGTGARSPRTARR
jgi:quercetin dioxygenase-like cupin family protein